MKINIIGPSCVGKTTLAKLVAKKHNWQHFDLDLVFIDKDYLAETKIFRYRTKNEYRSRIEKILKTNNDWVIEGVYAVDRIFEEADMIIMIKLPMLIPLRWQWKRYFSDKSQRDTYGFLNNIGLTRDIFDQYLKKCNKDDLDKETNNYICKYEEMLERYANKVKVVCRVEDLEKLRKGSYNDL